jgi:hypothetical protein
MRPAGEPFFGCGIRCVSLGEQNMRLRKALPAETILAVSAAAGAQPVTGHLRQCGRRRELVRQDIAQRDSG